MELRDLRYFAVIAEHGSVRRAAEALNLSQPGLSKSLRRLEQELRTKLVARTAKGVELTAVGSVLAAQIGRLQLSFEDVRARPPSSVRGEQDICVSARVLRMPICCPRRTPCSRKKHPTLRFLLRLQTMT